MSVSGRWFADALTYPHSPIVNVEGDPVVLAFHGNRFATAREHAAPQAEFEKALWLAYPLTHTWGHFVIEVLTRLAVYERAGLDTTVPVLVSAAVSGGILDFARFVFPWARFRAVDPGTSVQVAKATVIPSRVLSPGRLRWSADGDAHPMMEPQTLELVAKAMWAANEREHDQAPRFATRLYLDRSQGSYRRSASEDHAREIAETSGFEAIDPGSLSPKDEVNLLVNAREVAGFSGSQFILTAAMRQPDRALVYYHDLPTELRNSFWALAGSAGLSPEWVLGHRQHPVGGYSEQSIHQEILLSDAALEAARGWSTAR